MMSMLLRSIFQCERGIAEPVRMVGRYARFGAKWPMSVLSLFSPANIFVFPEIVIGIAVGVDWSGFGTAEPTLCQKS